MRYRPGHRVMFCLPGDAGGPPYVDPFMRGTVVNVSPSGRVKVTWDGAPEGERPTTINVAPENLRPLLQVAR